MCAKLLQICILAISIYISIGKIGYRDNDEPADGEEEPKYDGSAAPDYDNAPPGSEGANGAEPNVGIGLDYAGSNPEDANDDSGNIFDDEGQQNATYDDGDGNDDAGPEYENNNAYDDAEYLTSELDYDYTGGKITPLKMPGSTEMLDRNTPELGFDLSYDEMMKLKMWPDALIPYYIDVYSFNDKVMRDKIRSFLSSVNSLTALNFVELPSPPSSNIRWVFFVNRRGLLGCADHSIRNFTNAGVQQVVLGYHCMSTEGELAEAVLAIAGVPAQHNAPDRDYYILIKEENIIPEKKYLFEKRKDDEWLFHDLAYDFNSAGHFHSFKHSINGRATIETQKKNDAVTIGESKVLTASDILKIRMLYNFIVKKKLLQAPDCHKLFEPGKKFNQYKPSDQQKARPKPFRYTGEAPDAPLDEDDAEVDSDQPQIDDNMNNNKSNNDNFNTEIPYDLKPDGENNLPDNSTIINDGIDEEVSNESNDIDDAAIDDANENGQPPINNNNNSGDRENENNSNQNVPHEEDESDNLSPSEYPNKKPNIVNIDEGQTEPNAPILLLAGPQNSRMPPIWGNNPWGNYPWSTPRNKVTPDLLHDLSDYRTDEEDGRQAKKNHFFKYSKKVDLKFRPYG